MPSPAESIPVPVRQVTLEIPCAPPLADQIRRLRVEVGLPPDTLTAFPLGVTFSIPDEATWQFFSALLAKIPPLTLTLPHVEAQVEGQQTYRAGWQIDEDGQDQLRKLRAGLIAALKSAPVDLTPLGSLLLVADAVPVGAFPALIAAMQRDFEPITWSIQAVKMVTEPGSGSIPVSTPATSTAPAIPLPAPVPKPAPVVNRLPVTDDSDDEEDDPDELIYEPDPDAGDSSD